MAIPLLAVPFIEIWRCNQNFVSRWSYAFPLRCCNARGAAKNEQNTGDRGQEDPCQTNKRKHCGPMNSFHNKWVAILSALKIPVRPGGKWQLFHCLISHAHFQSLRVSVRIWRFLHKRLESFFWAGLVMPGTGLYLPFFIMFPANKCTSMRWQPYLLLLFMHHFKINWFVLNRFRCVVDCSSQFHRSPWFALKNTLMLRFFL